MLGKRETEVVVVGAGPVGLLAAISLKSAGVDVRLFDAGRHFLPRAAVNQMGVVGAQPQ